MIAAVCVVIEPLTQGELKEAMHSWQAALGLVSDVGLGVGQGWFQQQGGLVAPPECSAFSTIAAGMEAS